MNKPLLIAAVIILTLIINGCTEMTRSEINLCTKLASKSYAFVPACETESSCFDKVSILFKTNLDYAEESELYEIKNHFARSWYFYNLTLKEQKNLQKQCKSADASSAAGTINQMQDGMNDSFLELDLGMEKSFGLISNLEKKLSRDKIDMLKEEKLYSDLIEIRQIISELNSGATNSETYVSYYSKKAEEFKKSSASKGFNILIEKSPFWIDNFDIINSTILDSLGVDKEGYFPFANDILKSAISEAETAFFKKQSLLALQNFPISDFMKLYSDLGGNNNSAVKRFSDLLSRTSKDYDELYSKIQKSWETNETNLKKINDLLEKQNENAQFQSLFDLIAVKTITTDANTINEAKALTGEYVQLKERKAERSLSKGEELSSLLKMEIAGAGLIESLSFNTDDFEEKLVNACKKEAQNKIEADANNPSTLSSLISEINYFSSRVKNTSDRQCLLSCKELVEKKKMLMESLKDPTAAKETEKTSIKECALFLEKIFSCADLFELKSKYFLLKETELTKENITDFSRECSSIKNQVENELLTDEKYSALKEEYGRLQRNLALLRKVAYYINKESLYEINSKYEQEGETFFEYFENDLLIVDKLCPIIDSVLEKITLLNSKIEKLNKEKINEYVKDSITVSNLNSEIIEINKPFLSLTRLAFTNPFEKQPEGYIALNFDINQVAAKDPCVESVQKNIVHFSYLPEGSTKIDFFKEKTVSTSESDAFIYVTNESSLIKRTITLEPKEEMQMVLIKTVKPKDVFRTAVIINDSNSLIFENTSDTTKFILEKNSKDTKINVFYYINGGIELKEESIDTKTTDLDETIIYKINAKNTFPQTVSATLIFNLPSSSAEITLYSKGYAKKEIKKAADSIVLSNEQFLGEETKEYELWVKTSSALDYYREGLEKQKSFFEAHNSQKNAELTKNAIESEDLTLMKKIFESNAEEIKRIETEEQTGQDLQLMRQKLLEKIEDLRNKQSDLLSLGMDSDAKKIGTLLDSVLAMQLNTDSDIAKAFDKLLTASASADNEIKLEAEKMWDKIMSKTNWDENLLSLKEDFFRQKQLFDESFSFEPAKAMLLFSALKDDFNLFISLSSMLDKNILLHEKENQKKFNSDLNYCRTELGLIESDLLINGEAMIKTKFVFPLTQSRVEKLKLILLELENSDKPIDEKLKEIEPILDEIWTSRESVKKQAILAFNKAVDIKASNEILAHGRNLLDENKYVDAYIFLYSAQPLGQNILGFVWFLPILIIVVCAAVIKNRVRKKEKEEGEKRKIVLDEWEKI